MYKVFVLKYTDGTYHHGGSSVYGVDLWNAKHYSLIRQVRGVITRLIYDINEPYRTREKALLDGATIEEVTLTPTFSTVQYIELD